MQFIPVGMSRLNTIDPPVDYDADVRSYPLRTTGLCF